MTNPDIPLELLRKLMLLVPIESILFWCSTNNTIKLICDQEFFWQDKLNLDYPDYIGLPYKNSYKTTSKLLHWGKYINITNQIHGYSPNQDPYIKCYRYVRTASYSLLINSETTFDIIPQAVHGFDIVGEDEDYYRVNFFGNEFVIYDKEGKFLCRGDKITKLHTIVLQNNKNLLASIQRIDYSQLMDQ